MFQAPLRYGGWGLASAVRTSPAAYLGSLAAARSAPALAAFSKADGPVPSTSLLHTWIQGSLDAVVEATHASQEELPPSASTFVRHFTSASSSTSSSLQHTLSAQASSHRHEASMERARELRRVLKNVSGRMYEE